MVLSSKRRVRLLIVIGLLVLAVLVARPVFHLIYTGSTDTNELVDLPPGFVDDASRLNQTKVAEVWEVPFNHVFGHEVHPFV